MKSGPGKTDSAGTPSAAALWTRRSLLERAGAGILAPVLMGRGFIPAELLGQKEGSGSDGSDGPIVVVIQLGGGNDSLNTVVPYQGGQSSFYYDARPSLAVPAEQVLALGGMAQYGLHPALVSMRELWTRGEMAVVEGVGYPSPSLSHFSSMDYWHSAEPNGAVRDGWLGRYFRHRCAGDPACGVGGVDIGGSGNLAFYAGDPAGRMAMGNPREFGWRRAGVRPGGEGDFEYLVRRLHGIEGGVERFRRGRGPAFHYLRRSIQNAFQSADAVRQALDRAESGTAGAFPRSAFPDTVLAGRLLDIATLIHGRFPATTYFVEQSGYDTHGGQVSADAQVGPLGGRHAELLSELDGALGAFAAEMKTQGHWRRILVFTFSEFGRKVVQNGSFGTDHGAAQSVLAFGGSVRSGFYGRASSLHVDARVKNESMAFTTDFRRIYRTVLETWLGVSRAAVLEILPETVGSSFEPLNFV